MVEVIPQPDVHSLLPPLLACLPTAFASTRPPPAFLPLLSPILRQRLQLQTSTLQVNQDNWLRLLCWDNAKAETLREQVENSTFEPHPVSGEIEVGDINDLRYKRFDEETLKAQILLADWPFVPQYLWCPGTEQGNVWLLAELLPSDDATQADQTWSKSIKEANESSSGRIVTEALHEADASSRRKSPGQNVQEDDYWAMYDATPGRTPIRKSSAAAQGGSNSDADYYARYGEVQPAMDNHDPDEEVQDTNQSTLNGHTLQHVLSDPSEHRQRDLSPPTYQNAMDEHMEEEETEISQPVPSSPSSRAGSDNVARLERTAERYAASEIGIKQHISTTVKSMFRLARSAGMDREEFERIIQRECDALSIFEKDD